MTEWRREPEPLTSSPQVDVMVLDKLHSREDSTMTDCDGCGLPSTTETVTSSGANNENVTSSGAGNRGRRVFSVGPNLELPCLLVYSLPSERG